MAICLKNEPMSKHTSFRVGGVADEFLIPENLKDLQEFVKQKNPEQLFWLGLGSNILVRDGGIRGIVVAQSGTLDKLNILENNIIFAEVGVSCAKLSRFSKKSGLSGLAFLSGIPGSVGGALAMNAGAFGDEIWTFVKSVTVMNHLGELSVKTPLDYKISYRSVVPKFNETTWFVGAEFELSNDRKSDDNIKALLKKRNNSQPIGLPSCGSVFKNPTGQYAAELIEKSGLKGFCIGKACVSKKHTNFIINTGGATALEIEQLIKHIQSVVLDKFKVVLDPEVKIVGQI